jgi:DNA repair photolyase
MAFIYEPKGKAKEYAELACNIYTGCENACLYCYVNKMPFMKNFGATPVAREGILKGVDKELSTGKYYNREIHLTFIGDPYPKIENDITRQLLLLFEAHKSKIIILTKNPSRAIRDFDIIERNGWKFGVTISMNESSRRNFEPGAESIAKRFEALTLAKSRGIYTWVSVEPVINALEATTIISLLKGRVDEFRIGKINHFPELECKTDWYSFLLTVEQLLKGSKYLIKESLLDAALGNNRIKVSDVLKVDDKK